MPISDVSEKSGWIIVFDEDGKEIKRMGSSNKAVVGIASSFFVVDEGSWIVTYDEKCREIKGWEARIRQCEELQETHSQLKKADGSLHTIRIAESRTAEENRTRSEVQGIPSKLMQEE